MKLTGRDIALYAFHYCYYEVEKNEYNKDAALKIADRLLENRLYIELGLGDKDFYIQHVLEHIAGYGCVKTNAIGYSAKFFLKADYDLDDNELEKVKQEIYR